MVQQQFYSVDELTLEYLKMTGRTDDEIKVVEEYSSIKNCGEILT